MKTPREIADQMYGTKDLSDISEFNISLSSALNIADKSIKEYGLAIKLMELFSYTDKYELNMHTTKYGCSIYISKDGIDLYDIGAPDFEFVVDECLNYLQRVCKK